jgi:hypothetical protein
VTISPSSPAPLEFPLKVQPRLSHGPIHRVVLTGAAVEIITFAPETTYLTVLAIPHVRILEAHFVNGLLGDPSCRIIYRDETDQKKVVKLTILEATQLAADHKQTWAFTQTLQQLRTGQSSAATSNASLFDITNPSTIWSHPRYRRLIYGLTTMTFLLIGFSHLEPRLRILAYISGASLSAALAILAIERNSKPVYGFLLLGWPIVLMTMINGSIKAVMVEVAVLLSLTFTALGIDRIRLQPGWHPIVKVMAAVLIFCAAFVGTITLAAIFFAILEP